MFRISLLISAVMFSSPAFAHWGHVGELAGHGHLIGLGALAGAAALGVILRKPKKKKEDQPEEETPEGETA